MSRTWRTIPDSGFRDRTKIEGQRLLRSSEEKKGINNHEKKVRDKDNVGTHRTPKEFRDCHEKRYRSRVNDKLNKLSNECWNIPDNAGEEVVFPDPKSFQPWYR